MVNIFLIITQLLAIYTGTYLLLLERKHCKNCYWWWDTGALIMFITYLIPFVGILTSIAGCADCARNIVKELDNKFYDSKEKQIYER